MKIFLLFITIFLTLTFAFPVEKKFSKLNKNQELHLKLPKGLRQVTGSRVNVCYVIDGSVYISESEFERQKNFIFDATISAYGSGWSFAAVQYGSSIEPVTPLLYFDDYSFDAHSMYDPEYEFYVKIDDMKQLRDARTYMAGGIHYCADLLYPRKGEQNVIALLTTNFRQPFGGDPVIAADRFRNDGGDMFVISGGVSDSQELLDIVGGDATKVIAYHDYIDFTSTCRFECENIGG